MQIDTYSYTQSKPIVITEFDMKEINETQKQLDEDLSNIQSLDLFYKRGLVNEQDPTADVVIQPREKVKEEVKGFIQSKFNKFTDVFSAINKRKQEEIQRKKRH